MSAQKALDFRKFFQKYERFDDKREWAFKDLTDALNSFLQKEIREFSESSDSDYLVTIWQVGITRDSYCARLSNGKIVTIRDKSEIIIIVKELLHRNSRLRYDIDNPILNYEEAKKFQIMLTEYLNQKLKPSKIGYRHIKVYLFDNPNWPVKYAEERTPAFLLAASLD